MLLARHVLRLFGDLSMFSFATRRVSLLLVVVIGAALVVIGLAGQAAAPFVVYPFV